MLMMMISAFRLNADHPVVYDGQSSGIYLVYFQSTGRCFFHKFQGGKLFGGK